MFARVEIRETTWQAFLGEPSETVYGANPTVETMRGNGQLIQVEAVSPAAFVLIGCIGSAQDIQAFYDYFAPADRGRIWRWNFNGTVDFATEYTGQENDILATQPNFVEYDVDGNPVSTTPPTFETPNWAHGWTGQGKQQFAREFSREFGEEFG